MRPVEQLRIRSLVFAAIHARRFRKNIPGSDEHRCNNWTDNEAVQSESREAAELWLARNRHHQARIDEVTADEISADAVEGRAAA